MSGAIEAVTPLRFVMEEMGAGLFFRTGSCGTT